MSCTKAKSCAKAISQCLAYSGMALNCSNRGKRTEKDKDEILAVMMTARKGEVNCQRRRDEKGRRGTRD